MVPSPASYMELQNGSIWNLFFLLLVKGSIGQVRNPRVLYRECIECIEPFRGSKYVGMIEPFLLRVLVTDVEFGQWSILFWLLILLIYWYLYHITHSLALFSHWLSYKQLYNWLALKEYGGVKMVLQWWYKNN